MPDPRARSKLASRRAIWRVRRPFPRASNPPWVERLPQRCSRPKAPLVAVESRLEPASDLLPECLCTDERPRKSCRDSAGGQLWLLLLPFYIGRANRLATRDAQPWCLALRRRRPGSTCVCGTHQWVWRSISQPIQPGTTWLRKHRNTPACRSFLGVPSPPPSRSYPTAQASGCSSLPRLSYDECWLPRLWDVQPHRGVCLSLEF